MSRRPDGLSARSQVANRLLALSGQVSDSASKETLMKLERLTLNGPNGGTETSSYQSPDILLSDAAHVLGGGNPAQLTLNGVRCTVADRVAPGDHVEATPGTPIIESIVVETTETAQPLETRGSGAFVKVQSPGAPGRVTVKRGLITGQIIESARSHEPTATIVARFQYAVSKKLIVLSFDDGPHPVYLSLIHI